MVKEGDTNIPIIHQQPIPMTTDIVSNAILLKTKKRKKKDPNAPKRALSAFMYFAATRRVPLGEENPSMKMTDIARMIGKEWQELDDAGRVPFDTKAAEDKARYATEMESYVPPVSVSEDGKKKKKKKKKDPNAPKRGLSAFMFFAADRRQVLRDANPDKKMTEIASMLGTEWQSVTDDDKAAYVRKAAADKVRYETEMAAYNA